MNLVDSIIENLSLKSQDDLNEITVSETAFENRILQSSTWFCSEISRFKFRYEKAGNKYEKSFILKVPYYKSKANHYEILKHRHHVYKKEIYVYEFLCPLYGSLLPNDSLHPEFYGTDGKNGLILEDLSQFGYRTVEPHNEQLDLAHCIAAFKLLAKFHAVSVKIHETQPQILDNVRNESIMNSTFLSVDKYCKIFKNRFQNIIHRADPTFAKEHSNELKFLQNNFIHMVIEELKPDADSFNVLNHGDFWTNNIMFGYDSRDQVTNAKCTDLQLCRWASPAIDIVHFTITSMRVEVFDKYFNQLLESYITTLNATLRYLQSDHTFSIDDLRKDIEKKFGYFLYAVTVIAPVIFSGPENEVDDILNEEFVDEERYVKLSKWWISYFIKKGYFSKYEDIATAIDKFTRKFEAKNSTTISKYNLEYNLVKPDDNFCSVVTRLKFEYQMGDETIRTSVLLKIPSLSSNFNFFEQSGIYDHEIYVYTKLLPQLYQLWNGEHFTPHVYAITKSKTMVLEDLTEQEFRTCDKTKQLDLDHSRIAIATLARYHAITIKYLQILNNSVDPILKAPLLENDSQKTLEATLYNKFLRLINTSISESMHAKLLKYAPHRLPQMDENGDNLSAISHGDYRTNNILFRYDNQGRVCEAKIVDWQMCRKRSAVIDLIYFFLTSVRVQIIEDHYDSLLDLYLNTLNETLSTLKSNLNFTRSALDDDLQKYNYFYVLCLSSVLQLIMIKNDGQLLASANSTDASTQKYSSVALKWLYYLESKNII